MTCVPKVPFVFLPGIGWIGPELKRKELAIVDKIRGIIDNLDGGLIIGNEQEKIRAALIRVDGTPGPDVYMLREAGADFYMVWLGGRAYFSVMPEEAEWYFPVGSKKLPIEKWYIASRHLERGKIWAGGVHVGIDYNVETLPRGDIERGEPVWAVTDSVIYDKAWGPDSLGNIVLRVIHAGKPLWVGYRHLADYEHSGDEVYHYVTPGMKVRAGTLLGHIGNYSGSNPALGDHLHFDMCLVARPAGLWWTGMAGKNDDEKLSRWVDPVLVLKAHLPPDIVEASLRIG